MEFNIGNKRMEFKNGNLIWILENELQWSGIEKMR